MKVLSILAVTTVAYAIFLLTLPRPTIWASLKATSESIAFRAVNPELAVFHISGVRAFTHDNSLTGCVNGVIIPKAGARIEYRKGEGGFSRVVIDPPKNEEVSFTFRSFEPELVIKGVVGSVVFIADGACPGKAASRLPIWGPAEFGELVRSADETGASKPGMLVKATIEVYAYSQERLLGIRFPASIYPVTSFEVPAGAVLTSLVGLNSNDIWSGVAVASNDNQGFSVIASSQGHDIALYTPLPAVGGRTRPQKIELDDYALFLKDPNIIQLQFLIAAFLFLFNSIVSIAKFFYPDGKVK